MKELIDHFHGWRRTFQSNRNFPSLYANFGKHHCMLSDGKFVGRAEPHPTSMTEYNFTMAENLGLADEEDHRKGERSEDLKDLNLALSTNQRKNSY